jgi:hypothetical protein
LSGLITLAGVALTASPPAQALTIDVSYNAGTPLAWQTDFNNLVSLYDSTFTDPITVNVTVGPDPTCGLGCSSTFRVFEPYGTWRAAMSADAAGNPQNTFVAAAVASLPLADPIGNGTVLLRTADARALGLSAAVPVDSNLTFSSTKPYSFGGVAAPGAYTFIDVAAHELDEALGIGSVLTNLVDNAPLPTTFEAEDYFRYGCGSTSRDISTDPNASVCFSFDGGVTDVARFNQEGGTPGDFHNRNDWIYAGIGPGFPGCPAAAPGPYVQDAFTCFDEAAPLLAPGTPEFQVLAALGYDPAAVVVAAPEPGTLALLGTSLFGLAALGRRRKRAFLTKEPIA